MAFDRGVRVSLGVVTLGTPDRLAVCLDALRAHESRHGFTVVAIVNADAVAPADQPAACEGGVLVDRVPFNAGWAGGLHRARALTDAELLVWVQDDMVPEPGWLDALVDAADRHPRVGGFGSVRVDAEGRPTPPNAGAASPYDAVERWNDTDTTAETLPEEVTTYDWVTSTGFLTRAAAWDELGGTDPRLWPVNHGDKEYCTHLRCHGWDVALVPGARVRHAGAQSSPTAFRAFVAGWREPWFNGRWSNVVAELGARSSAVVAHPCRDWEGETVTPLEAVAGGEATRMMVPLARALAEQTSTAAHWHRVREEDLVRQVEHHRHAWEESHAHAERLTAALVAAEQERDRARRRVRLLRRRVAEAGRGSPEPLTLWSRLRRRLRG